MNEREEQKDQKFIDVEMILKTRAPKLYRFLPRFLLNYVRKELHEDDINRAMKVLHPYHGLEFNNRTLEYLGITVDAVYHDRLPEKGPCIVVSNHPLGGLDGMALIKKVSESRTDIRFLVNDILLQLKNFGELFVGVNKLGGNPRDRLLQLDKIFSGDNTILIFPAGLVSRKQNGVIKDLPWNKTFVTKSKKHGIPIYPVFIEGKNSAFFYNFARFRKCLGIKANIEMMLLPDEMFRQKNAKISMIFGKSIHPVFLGSEFSDYVWAQKIKEYVYSEEMKKGISFQDLVKKGKI
jgi:putative hemolysin